jgi:hypothetical protein
MFYRPDGKTKQDADIHNGILDEGDHAAAEKSGRAAMERAGLSPERIEALMTKKAKK